MESRLLLVFVVTLFVEVQFANAQPYQFGLQCQNPGVCSLNGDPHYKSFDNLYFDWQGICKYNLVSYCGQPGRLPGFRVFSKNEHRWGFTNVAYARYVEIHYAGDIIVLGRNTNYILVNGLTRATPYATNFYTVSTSFGYAIFTATTDLLQVAYDGWMSVVVMVAYQYSNQVCGLCGNFDGNAANDWLTSNGVLATTGMQLGDSWVIADPDSCERCPERRIKYDDTIPVRPVSRRVEAACKVLVDVEGVLGRFVQRTSEADRERARAQCVLDAGYTRETSVRYSIRHAVVVHNARNAGCAECQVDLATALRSVGFIIEGERCKEPAEDSVGS